MMFTDLNDNDHLETMLNKIRKLSQDIEMMQLLIAHFGKDNDEQTKLMQAEYRAMLQLRDCIINRREYLIAHNPYDECVRKDDNTNNS